MTNNSSSNTSNSNNNNSSTVTGVRGPVALPPFSPPLSSLSTSSTSLPSPHAILTPGIVAVCCHITFDKWSLTRILSAATSDSLTPPTVPRSTAIRFEAMKNEIDRFKREMGTLQSEIDSLQEQLQV